MRTTSTGIRCSDVAGEPTAERIAMQTTRERIRLAAVAWFRAHPGPHQLTAVATALRDHFPVGSSIDALRRARRTFRPVPPPPCPNGSGGMALYVDLPPELYHPTDATMTIAHHIPRRCKTRTRATATVPACPLCASPSERHGNEHRRCTHRLCGHVFAVDLSSYARAT